MLEGAAVSTRLADTLYKQSFGRRRVPIMYKTWQQFPAITKFELDGATSELLVELTNMSPATKSDAALFDLIELARPPFFRTWFELDMLVFEDKRTRVGWFLEGDERTCIASFSLMRTDGLGQVLPTSISWQPTNPGAGFGIGPHKDAALLPFEKDDLEVARNAAQRQTWPLLILLSKLALMPRTEVVSRAPKGFMARNTWKPFLEFRTVKLSLTTPQERMAFCQQHGTASPRKRHEVRGHFKRLRNGERGWVASYERGDASLGYIKHNYEVTL